jgi:hypothetical protein
MDVGDICEIAADQHFFVSLFYNYSHLRVRAARQKARI